MEQINSVSSRKMTPTDSMMKLERACFEADCRFKIRVDQQGKARFLLGMMFSVPFATYLLYNMMAPSGVMMNHRASQGAYMWYL